MACGGPGAASLPDTESAFVANVSHELRTPLASIAVVRRVPALRARHVAGEGRRVRRPLEHESNRLRHLIDNVLDFARIESAAVEYRPDDAAIEDSVGAAVSAVDARRERDGFTILVTCPDSLLPAVRIDEEAMTRVFVNLLDNAMKYSGRSRRVRVDLSCRDDGVAVAVTDFGIGVAPDEQERIFDRFYRPRRRSTTVSPERASGWRSSGRSCTRTAGRSRSTAARAAAPRSPW